MRANTFFFDLHGHSKYSGGTSMEMNLHNLAVGAKQKGLHVLGSGDILHSQWYSEVHSSFQEINPGFYKYEDMYWLLSCEISNVFTEGNHERRIHHVVLFPNFEVVMQVRDVLKSFGELDNDGRPTFTGLSIAEMVEMLIQIDPMIEIIPAHIWTPWYSLFGSKYGFDSIKDCYQDQIKHIHLLETGLSSDPPMNWRLSELDPFYLVSFSDAHSPWPWRIGREATALTLKKPLDEHSYKDLITAFRSGQIALTVEVDPSYGKYHFDGHRSCNVRLDPEETKKFNGKCPQCKRPLTIGVLHRVEQLADRKEHETQPQTARPFKRVLPLAELIRITLNLKSLYAKTVQSYFQTLISAFDNEFEVLFNVSIEDLVKVIHPEIAKAIWFNREGLIRFKPGYDGVYGEPLFPTTDEVNELPEVLKIISARKRGKSKRKSQRSLSDFF